MNEESEAWVLSSKINQVSKLETRKLMIAFIYQLDKSWTLLFLLTRSLVGGSRLAIEVVSICLWRLLLLSYDGLWLFGLFLACWLVLFELL